MFLQSPELKVYLAPGATDMRKAINGLSMLVESLELDPFSETIRGHHTNYFLFLGHENISARSWHVSHSAWHLT